MPQEWLRFGVRDGHSRWSATWKLWTEGNGEQTDVCLGSASLGGWLRVRIRPPGPWSLCFTPTDGDVGGVAPDVMQRLSEIADRAMLSESSSGYVSMFRILIPASSVSLPNIPGKYRHVSWIPVAPAEKAVETTVVIVEQRDGLARWPTRALVRCILLGSLELASGGRASVLYRIVDAPNEAVSADEFRLLHTVDTRSHLGRLAIGRDPDGVIVIQDLTVSSTSAQRPDG
jgi:hypothetical protein